MSAIELATKGGIRTADLTSAIRAAVRIEDVSEARARIEAVKAWAKVHGKTKDMRLDLLRLEVEALVRLVELDGLDTLTPAERKAARHLASLTSDERDELITRRGTFTTASGMCAAMWREEHLERQLDLSRRRGREFASSPGRSAEYDPEEGRDAAHSIANVLGGLLDVYTNEGQPFTTSEIADHIISEAAQGDAVEEDAALLQGVREVVREAIRKAPALSIDGTVLPRLVTARTDEGQHVRVPVEFATMAHLADMIAMRREQLEQDRKALERLQAIEKKLQGMPGGSVPTTRIGALVAASVLADTA